MPTPTVTGFTANGDLGGNKKGLKSKNNSTSPVVITGTNLTEQGMTVYVNPGQAVSWAGDLYLADNLWKANLKCTNTSSGVGDSQDVTVTVTGSVPPDYTTQVDVGPGT
jgi:hypothetical protein